MIYTESPAGEKQNQSPEQRCERPWLLHFHLGFHLGFCASIFGPGVAPEIRSWLAPENAPGWLAGVLAMPGCLGRLRAVCDSLRYVRTMHNKKVSDQARAVTRKMKRGEQGRGSQPQQIVKQIIFDTTRSIPKASDVLLKTEPSSRKKP